MTTKPKSTACRICGDTPYKGARCKFHFNEAHRLQQEARRKAANKTCSCGRSMGAQAKRCYFCIWGTTGEEHRQPRVYQKPPESQKLQRMSRTEKREVVDVPVLDTQDEKARYEALLARARANRIPCNISRFSDDRDYLL